MLEFCESPVCTGADYSLWDNAAALVMTSAIGHMLLQHRSTRCSNHRRGYDEIRRRVSLTELAKVACLVASFNEPSGAEATLTALRILIIPTKKSSSWMVHRSATGRHACWGSRLARALLKGRIDARLQTGAINDFLLMTDATYVAILIPMPCRPVTFCTTQVPIIGANPPCFCADSRFTPTRVSDVAQQATCNRRSFTSPAFARQKPVERRAFCTSNAFFGAILLVARTRRNNGLEDFATSLGLHFQKLGRLYCQVMFVRWLPTTLFGLFYAAESLVIWLDRRAAARTEISAPPAALSAGQWWEYCYLSSLLDRLGELHLHRRCFVFGGVHDARKYRHLSHYLRAICCSLRICSTPGRG